MQACALLTPQAGLQHLATGDGGRVQRIGGQCRSYGVRHFFSSPCSSIQNSSGSYSPGLPPTRCPRGSKWTRVRLKCECQKPHLITYHKPKNKCINKDFSDVSFFHCEIQPGAPANKFPEEMTGQYDIIVHSWESFDDD